MVPQNSFVKHIEYISFINHIYKTENIKDNYYINTKKFKLFCGSSTLHFPFYKSFKLYSYNYKLFYLQKEPRKFIILSGIVIDVTNNDTIIDIYSQSLTTSFIKTLISTHPIAAIYMNSVRDECLIDNRLITLGMKKVLTKRFNESCHYVPENLTIQNILNDVIDCPNNMHHDGNRYASKILSRL